MAMRKIIFLAHEGLAGCLWPYQAILLIFRSEFQWNAIVQARRSFAYIIWLFFVPMILTLAGLEGWGIQRWARWHDASGLVTVGTTSAMLQYEAKSITMALLSLLFCAHFFKVFAETFRGRNTYQQAFTVAIYSFAPFFLMRILYVFYPANEWLLWAFGLVFSLKVLYHGLPRILEPDAPHALGLFFSSGLSLIMVTLLERFITLWYFGRIFQQPNPMSLH